MPHEQHVVVTLPPISVTNTDTDTSDVEAQHHYLYTAMKRHQISYNLQAVCITDKAVCSNLALTKRKNIKWGEVLQSSSFLKNFKAKIVA